MIIQLTPDWTAPETTTKQTDLHVKEGRALLHYGTNAPDGLDDGVLLRPEDVFSLAAGTEFRLRAADLAARVFKGEQG